MVVTHERLRLQLVDQVVGLAEPPVNLRRRDRNAPIVLQRPELLIPPSVEPDPSDLAVATAGELAQLRIHVVQISVEVAAVGPTGKLTRATARIVVRVMPVEVRVVE